MKSSHLKSIQEFLTVKEYVFIEKVMLEFAVGMDIEDPVSEEFLAKLTEIIKETAKQIKRGRERIENYEEDFKRLEEIRDRAWDYLNK